MQFHLSSSVYLLVCLMEASSVLLRCVINGAWWLSCRFGALCPEGRRFESHSSRLAGTLGSRSFVVACSASACKLRQSISAVVGSASE